MTMNVEIKIDEQKIAESIISDLKRHSFMNEHLV